VLVAANGDEAVQQFERNPPIDLLLTDIVMPGTSGPASAKQLMDRRQALKVIYMTGHLEDALVARSSA
jgi:two-component system cell cycle sensor histidine kinase/response regulator CckA